MTSGTGPRTERPWGFLIPLVFFLGVFLALPVLGTLVTSLFREVAFLETRFTGLENYRHLLTDARFWKSCRFTLCFVLASVTLEMALGLAFALVLNEKLPCRGILRAAALVPWAIPLAVSSRIWELIYDFHYGLANAVLASLHLSGGPVNWLGTTSAAFWALVLADTWKTVPFVAIILLAGLQSVPETLYQQARMDRAGLFGRFRHVTLPLLKPALTVALLFRTIDGLRVFDLIYVITGGGPGGSTASVSLYAYEYFLMSDFGYGSAVSVVLFVFAFLLAVLYVRAGRFTEGLCS